jgi:hypothetical protein
MAGVAKFCFCSIASKIYGKPLATNKLIVTTALSVAGLKCFHQFTSLESSLDDKVKKLIQFF